MPTSTKTPCMSIFWWTWTVWGSVRFILTGWEMSCCRDGRCVRSRGCGGISCFTAAAQRDPLQKPGVGGVAKGVTTRHWGTATEGRMRLTASPDSVAAWVCIFGESKRNDRHLKCNYFHFFFFSAVKLKKKKRQKYDGKMIWIMNFPGLPKT